MRERLRLFLKVIVVILLSYCWAGDAFAIVLLFQDNVLWKGYIKDVIQPYTALSDLKIDYKRVKFEELANINLSNYDVVFLAGSANNTGPYLKYAVPNMSKLANYVNSGGLLIIHFASWGDDNTYLKNIGPGNLSGYILEADDLTIVPGMENDSLFVNVDNDSLDNWLFSAHGYFTNLPPNTQELIVNQYNEPVYIRYPIGKGQVWATMMPLEIERGDTDLLYNELKLAGKFKNIGRKSVVPEPSTFFLSLLGIAFFMFGFRIRFV